MFAYSPLAPVQKQFCFSSLFDIPACSLPQAQSSDLFP